MSKDDDPKLEDFLKGRKGSVDALRKFYEKDARRPTGRTNEKPEREVQKAIFGWAKQNGIDLYVTDAASHNQRYDASPFEQGHSDLSGDDPNGIAVYIECKAPGKMSTLSFNQYLFLKRKIERGCFAIHTDNPTRAESLYRRFLSLTHEGLHSVAQSELIGELPQKHKDEEKRRESEELF